MKTIDLIEKIADLFDAGSDGRELVEALRVRYEAERDGMRVWTCSGWVRETGCAIAPIEVVAPSAELAAHRAQRIARLVPEMWSVTDGDESKWVVLS
jgi:hypothetical protein